MSDEAMTPAEVAAAMEEELGVWTLSELNHEGLWSAVQDTWPGFNDLDEREQDDFFSEVLIELT